jgi:hypothetical protein
MVLINVELDLPISCLLRHHSLKEPSATKLCCLVGLFNDFILPQSPSTPVTALHFQARYKPVFLDFLLVYYHASLGRPHRLLRNQLKHSTVALVHHHRLAILARSSRTL